MCVWSSNVRKGDQPIDRGIIPYKNCPRPLLATITVTSLTLAKPWQLCHIHWERGPTICESSLCQAHLGDVKNRKRLTLWPWPCVLIARGGNIGFRTTHLGFLLLIKSPFKMGLIFLNVAITCEVIMVHHGSSSPVITDVLMVSHWLGKCYDYAISQWSSRKWLSRSLNNKEELVSWHCSNFTPSARRRSCVVCV